jgi:hypothetical protein
MPPARLRTPVVPKKVKAAFEFLYATPGASLQAAAQHVGMPTFKLRYAMVQPHCVAWMLREKQARLEACVPGNISALTSIRDDRSNQMASVAAVRQLEIMLDNTAERTGIGRQAQEKRAPGLQIVVLQSDGSSKIAFQPPAPAATPLIEATPESVTETSVPSDPE